MNTASSDTAPQIADGLSAFKLAFRRLAAGVSVVTARDVDGTPVGFTATSLASLAAVPPLATFNMARTASAWPAIEKTSHVIVHIMGASNRDVAAKMAAAHDERFVGEHWSPGPLDLPLLNDVPAWMLGRIVERYPVRDNAVVVVEIEDGGLGTADEALLYHERQFLKLGEPA